MYLPGFHKSWKFIFQVSHEGHEDQLKLSNLIYMYLIHPWVFCLYALCYSQLSPCRYHTIMDIPLLRTAAEVPENKNLLKTTPTFTDFVYDGHQILNVDVRQFQTETAKLPEITSHPCSNSLQCKWEKLTVKRAIAQKISNCADTGHDCGPLNISFKSLSLRPWSIGINRFWLVWLVEFFRVLLGENRFLLI